MDKGSCKELSTSSYHSNVYQLYYTEMRSLFDVETENKHSGLKVK